MSKCIVNKETLEELERDIQFSLEEIDFEAGDNTVEFVAKCKEYFNTKLKEISSKYNLRQIGPIVDKIYELAYDSDLTNLAPDYFSKDNIENTIKNLNHGIKVENQSDFSSRIIEPITTNLDITNISEVFLYDAYKSAIDVRISATKLFNKLLVDYTLVNREEGSAINGTANLNKSIKNLQQKLLSNIYNYISSIPKYSDLKEFKLFDDNGDYTGVLETNSKIINNSLSTTSEGLEQLLIDSKSGNIGAGKQLLAYNSLVLLKNFDTFLKLKYKELININNFGKFNSENKYSWATKGLDVSSTFKAEDDYNPADMVSSVIKEIINTTEFYKWDSRETPTPEKYLNFSDFSYIVAKIKNLGWTNEAFNITLDKSFINMATYNSLSKNTQGIIDQWDGKKITLSYLINIYRQNPQIYVPILLDLLTNKNFYDLCRRSEATNIYREFKKLDKDILYSVYKGLFSDELSSLKTIYQQYPQSLQNYYEYLSQVYDSIFKVDFLQYYLDDDGTFKVRTLLNSSYSNLTRSIESVINATHSRKSNSYKILSEKYKLTPLKDNNEIEFYPVKDLKVKASTNGIEFIVPSNTNMDSYWRNPKFKEFLEDMLKLGLGIDKDNSLDVALRQEYQDRDMVSDILKFASRVFYNQYVSNKLINNSKKGVKDLKEQVNKIYGLTQKININYKLGEISLISSSDVDCLKLIASAKANLLGLYTSTSVKNAEGKTQSNISLSRLLGALPLQWTLQNRQEGSATKDCLLINNPDLYKGFYTLKEVKTGNNVKAHIDFNAGEYAYSSFILDYLGGIYKNREYQDVLGDNYIGIIPSENSDKPTIGKMIINLNVDSGINHKAIKDLNVEELQQLTSRELGTFYSNMLNNIQKDLKVLMNFIQNYYYKNYPNIFREDEYVTEQEILNNFPKLNKFCQDQGISTVQFLSDACAEYNKLEPNNPLMLIDQVHFVPRKDGTIATNLSLLANIYRFTDISSRYTFSNLNLLDSKSFWKFQNFQLLKDLLKNNFKVDLTNQNQKELIGLKDKYPDWISDSGNMILAKSDFGNIIDISDLPDDADWRTPNIVLHPELTKYNILDYLFSEEFLNTSVGSYIAHPNKYNGDDPIVDEALRKKAQNKRNVSLTAAMNQLLLGTINGAPEVYNIACIDEPHDKQYNSQGIITDVKPMDGSTYVDPFTVVLENNSLEGAKVGITKKIFVHAYNEHTGTGVIIKTACFGLTNDLARCSASTQVKIKNMTDRPWLEENSNNQLIIDITKDYNGNKIAYDNINTSSSDGSFEDIFYKEKGLYYKVLSIDSLGNNNYRVTREQVDETGNPVSYAYDPKANTVTIKGELYNLNDATQENNNYIISNGDSNYIINIDTSTNSAQVLETSEKPVNTNFKLWNLFGGMNSCELRNGYLVPSEVSIHRVVKAMCEVGIKKSNVVRTGADVYQPLKHSDIHYLATAGAIKQGTSNINNVDLLNKEGTLNFMRVRVSQTGVQLDKEHAADNTELSLMTQVISACSSRGYTFDRALKLYRSLRTITDISTKEISTAFEQYVQNPKENRDKLQAVINKIIVSNLASSGINETNFASLIAKDFIKQVKENKEINWNQDILPMSESAVYSKLCSSIAVSLTNSAIKLKIPGILAVLNPSYNIVKIYGNKKLDEFDNPEVELKELQQEYDSNPVINASSEQPIDSIADIRIGRTYKVVYTNPNGESNIEYRVMSIPSDRWKLKRELNNYLQTTPNSRLSIIEYVKEGRELASYDCTFNGVDESGKVTKYSLYDLDDTVALFDLRDLEDQQKINEIAINNLSDDYLEKYIKWKYPEIAKNINQEIPLKSQLSGVNFDKKTVEILLRRNLQEDYEALSESSDKNLVRINNKVVKVDKSTINIIPYELILPKIFANQFGLEEFDSLSEIKNDPNFFTKRFLQRYRSTILNENNYDIELKRLNGKHYYILDSANSSQLTNDLQEITPIIIQNESGEYFRLDQNKNKIYQVSSSNDKFYVDKTGTEIIVTNNIKFYLDNLSYSSVKFSNKDNMNYDKYVPVLQESKNKVSNRYFKYFSFKYKTYQELNKQLSVIPQFKSVEDLETKIVKYPYLKLFLREGQEIYTSFIKSLDIIASRTPSQSQQSFMAMQIAAFDNPNRNNAYVSTAQIWLQGSDY